MNEDEKPPLYDLCGIVYHYGSLGGGHYNAACKNSDNRWYKYDDSNVCVVDNPQNLVNEDAYVFLY